LNQPEPEDAKSAKLLARMDYFITTDYHFNQVKELGDKYKKKTVQIRLNPDFVPALIAAARHQGLLMIVSDTRFFPAFRRNMLSIGISPALLEQITVIDDRDFSHVRTAIECAKVVYISPICNPDIRQLIPKHVKEIQLTSMVSSESLEMLEAIMLFHK
jgi:hypothetical protein